MKILGIANAETSSAVIFDDGRLIAAASEERFTRKKMDESYPYNSISYVLNESGISKKEVDIISYAWSKGFPEDALYSQFDRVQKLEIEEKNIFLERLKAEQARDFPKRDEFWKIISNDPEFETAVIEDFYHHEAHALSACMISPYDECAVLTCDGRGDYESLTFSYFNKHSNTLRKFYSSNTIDSLGFFYGRITGLLGYTPCRHEGKITGLAAHGNPRNAKSLMEKIITYESGHICSKMGDYYRPFYSNYSDALIEEIGRYSKEDVAAAAQYHLEEVLAEFVSDQYEKNGLLNLPLCLAGGVFGNVKVNAKLRDLNCVSGLFVQPQMGDGGLAIGAACGSMKKRGIMPKPNETMALGPHGGCIDSLISEKCSLGFQFEKLSKENLQDAIVSQLMNSQVVGLVRGRMEFGPRALCNRSIIFRTSDTSCNDWLNKRMSRTEFMPFAPVLTAENAKKHISPFELSDQSLWFMTATVNVSDQFKKLCPAVTHIDGTARPQIVSEARDAWLHSLLRKWETQSGEFALINTSFNRHEEPIVRTYSEAFTNLENGVVDVLELDDYFITKTI